VAVSLILAPCTTVGCGTQAEYVRIPHADTSNLPTGFECGVPNGKVEPGSTVAIVGAGPIGLAALLTAQFYSPAQIIMIDRDASFRASRPPSATYPE
jgi:alcohol dehydrogenase